jgi:nucleolar protein 12
MLPRVLRVTRAKAVKKTALAAQHARQSGRPALKESGNSEGERIYNPKVSAEQKSLQGRAARLLGKSGAARFKKITKLGNRSVPANKQIEGIAKTPESIVFEGYRASAKSNRPKDLKLGGSGGGKRKGKPGVRSTKRSSEWKKGGVRKTK